MTLKSCGDWLKGSVLGEQLLGLIEELCRIDGSSPISAYSAGDHRWALISLVLSQNHNNGEKKHSTMLLFPFLNCPQCCQIWSKLFYICFCLRRVSDWGGVHGEDVREAPHYSDQVKELIRWRQLAAINFLHLWRDLHLLLYCPRLLFITLCSRSVVYCVPINGPRPNTQSPDW